MCESEPTRFRSFVQLSYSCHFTILFSEINVGLFIADDVSSTIIHSIQGTRVSKVGTLTDNNLEESSAYYENIYHWQRWGLETIIRID